MNKFLGLMAAASLTMSTLGCATTEADEEAPTFEDGQGDVSWNGADADYPPAPYGIRTGQVIPDFEFFGFYDYMNLGPQITPIALADFYNPTGDEVFPEGHPFAGRAKPKIVVMIVSASWCPPCRAEAAEDIPEKRGEYGDDVMFLSTLTDGPDPGTAATFTDLERWTQDFPVDYPMAIDPANQIHDLYPRAAFPANMMIRTDTMQIVRAVNAAPDASFWLQAENIIAGNG